jgi:Uncharacterized protein conserved in bacteria
MEKTEFLSGLGVEVKKTKYRKIWLVILGICLLHFMWLTWILVKSDSNRMKEAYDYILFEFPLLNSITLPVVIAMIASRLCDIENKGNTLKLLYTIQKKGSVFDCKLLLGSFYIALIVALQILMVKIQSILFHFGVSMPEKQMFCYAISTFLVSFAILIIQQILSLLFDNQIAPLAIGLFGSFIGLFSLFFPKTVQRLVLWGYYSIFSTVGSSWNKDTRVMKFFEVPFDSFTLVGFILFILIIYLLGKNLFLRKEV